MKAQKKIIEPVENDRLSKPIRKANSLDGKTWLRYSISIWDDIRKNPEEIRLNQPAKVGG